MRILNNFSKLGVAVNRKPKTVFDLWCWFGWYLEVQVKRLILIAFHPFLGSVQLVFSSPETVVRAQFNLCETFLPRLCMYSTPRLKRDNIQSFGETIETEERG